jgi:hypothetical protein
VGDLVRRAAVAGTWYPGDRAALEREVDGHLARARVAPPPGRLVALISPHAGLRYSGPVAAYGLGLLRGRPGLTVVMVGPSHRAAFDGCAVYARGAWETPLGTTPVDDELAAALLAEPGLHEDPRPHAAEHSLEMQMPFLQRLVPGLRIVPVLMGTQSRDEVDALAAALVRPAGGRDAILLASSDLSHYHPAHVAHRLDETVLHDVERLDPESLMRRLEGTPEHACGGGAMVAVMRAARVRGADRAAVLRYADSGDVAEGDKSRVVGYLSAALMAAA